MRKVLISAVAIVVSYIWAGNLIVARPGESGPADDGTKAGLVKVAGEGLLNSHAFQYLAELSDDIGARVTGSPQGQKAIDWGAAKMNAIGLENVHTEKYQMWRGWTRGAADAELLSPVRHKLHVDAMGWTGSTPAGGAEGDVIAINFFNLDDEMKHSGRWAGKVLLIERGGTPRKPGDAFVDFGTFLRAAKKGGAIAVIGGQGGSMAIGMNLTHTGILGFAADFDVPVLSMTVEDQSQLARYVSRGITPHMRINVQNTFTNGPVESANVVGEIRGREHPEQVFVVGAHLDSWDLSEGSTDNGTGATSVLGAAEAIVRSGQRPRRTIRFVLFTGEEEGLLGSVAYVRQHKAEMDNHLGCLVIDHGQGPIKGFELGGRGDLVTAFEPFAKTLADIRPVEVDDKVSASTDTLPFSVVGLPGINMEQDSPDYQYTHHSPVDSLEYVKPEILTQNTTIMALTAYWIADRPERFASPWSVDRTEKMLRDKHQLDFLKSIKLWPINDLGS